MIQLTLISNKLWLLDEPFSGLDKESIELDVKMYEIGYLSDTKKQAIDDIESGAHRDIHEYFSTISDNGID